MCRLTRLSAAAALAALLIPALLHAQDESRSIASGGISVSGWQGKADANRQNQTVNDAKLSGAPDQLQVTTGPAVTYWNPADTASGDYTVTRHFHRAEVHEPQHPSASLWHLHRRQ